MAECAGHAIADLRAGERLDVARLTTHIAMRIAGKTLFDISISALRYKGVFVHYGRAGGPIPPLSLWDQPDGVHLVRCRGDARHESIDQWRRHALQVMQWIEDGTLDVLIGRTYCLEDAAAAHCDLESQETMGKLLLLP